MDLRNKLLLYFSGLVVVTIIAFGLSAYQVAESYIVNRDRGLLENLFYIQSKEIAEEYRHTRSLEHLLTHFTGQRTDNHVWFLFDKDYRVLNYYSNDNDLISRVLLKKFIDDEKNSGSYIDNSRILIWAKSRLDGTDYTAIHVYSPDYSRDEYFARLATRLIVVAIIILWLAIWAALIISTVITRKIKDQQEKIEFQANHDVVTGLQNRYFLTNKINSLISNKDTVSLAVIIIGIDRFREINDTLGHEFGDLLLKEFGSRMVAEFWSNDTIARFGSDQYSLLLPLSDHSHWKIVVEKIEKILSNPFLIRDIHIITDVSIGISVFPDHGDSSSQLLRCAEVAMYMAKKSGSLYECYDHDKDPNSLDRLQLISELNYAIEKGELELHYQPKIDIEKHQLVGCEALLRWNNGTRGRIPPDVFIPLAEQGNSIKALTKWVLEESVRQCAAWHKTGKDISVSVNLSARLLIEDEIITLVTQALEQYNLRPEYLILEITETAIMIDPVRARKMMEHLNDAGVKLSIDDFGTGYTSISQIKNLPVSEIKIDKSFVFNMLKENGDAMLVKLIIDMSHGMGHVVVAEGIESQEVLSKLKSLGCDIAQGYYLGRPMTALQFGDYHLS